MWWSRLVRPRRSLPIPPGKVPPLRISEIEDLQASMNDLLLSLQSFSTRLTLYSSTHTDLDEENHGGT